jgi:hypothetical protein
VTLKFLWVRKFKKMETANEVAKAMYDIMILKEKNSFAK